MARTPRDRLEHQREKVRELADKGEIPTKTREALLKWSYALDSAKASYKYRDGDGDIETYKPRTNEGYLRNLRICCENGLALLDSTANEFNEFIDTMHDDQGKSKPTLARYQCAAQTFYRYHDDLDVNPDAIHVYKERSPPKHDETDMFNEEEVTALRQACGASEMPTRNRALLELLVFTGQRIKALITLRKGDVKLNPPGNDNNSYIYLNDDYEREHGGLKGALVRGRKRPMFGARKYVRDYIEYHRQDAAPDDWLFIGNPSHWKTDPDDHWAEPSAEQVLKRIADEAGVQKPVNPHNFRHYCATILYRDYDLDKATIRMLFGHVEGSSALEETYSHLFEEDYIKKAEITLGYREEEDRSPFTPDACPTCGEILEDHWRQCPSCQEVFGPTDDFEERLTDVRERIKEEGIEARDPDEIDAYKAIINAINDPVALAEELAELGTT